MAQDELDLLLRSVPDAPKPRAAKQRDPIDDLLDAVPDAPRRAPAASKSLASPASARGGVDPRLDSFVNDVIGEASRRSGFTYKLGDGLRTPEQQAEKVARGVSWTKNSRHLHGRGRDVLAFDPKGNYITDGAHPAYAALGEVYGERSASAPARIRWGVLRDGKQVDPGHFELEETDEIDALLSTLPDEQPKDEIDALLESVPDDDVDERVNSVPASQAVASSTPPKPLSDSLNPYSPEDRAQRDAAAASRVRAVTVPLTRSLADYEDSASLMADAYREGARALNIDPAFVEDWIAVHPGDMRIIGDPSQPDATPADLLGSPAHDAGRNTVRLELGGLADLERDYKAQRSTPQRVVDFATNDTTTAGEKFLDVAAPVASAAGRVGDLATRPLQAASTALWSLARKHSPSEAASDAWTELRTGETPAGAGNWLAEKTRRSETLSRVNPNLPALAGGVVEMITDPANLAPLGMLARGGAALRGLKGVRAVEEALLASRDARFLEFYQQGGRILKIEAAPLDELASVADDAAAAAVAPVPHFRMTLKDADGAEHVIDTSAYYAGGQKPKLKSVPADRELAGVGLEREGASGRVYHDGQPQDFVMDSDGSLRASPVGGATTARESSALVPEKPETLAAQVQAMRAGRRAVVVVTPDAVNDVSQKVIVPNGMRSFGTPEGGRIIYNPAQVERTDVVRRMDDGTLSELMGHVEPKPANPAGVVVARDAAGNEIQTSYVSSARKADEQAAAFAEQHPGAGVQVGGPELEREVLAGRRATAADTQPGNAAASEWQPFPADSGTLNIPRASMPQIKGEHRGALVQFLKGRGISHTQEEVAANSLKPSQAEFSPAKVERARGFEGKQRSILISSDNHVLDGHHQWVKDLEDAPDAPIPVIRLDAPARQLLIEAARFPSSGVDVASKTGAKEVGGPRAASSALPELTDLADQTGVTAAAGRIGPHEGRDQLRMVAVGEKPVTIQAVERGRLSGAWVKGSQEINRGRDLAAYKAHAESLGLVSVEAPDPLSSSGQRLLVTARTKAEADVALRRLRAAYAGAAAGAIDHAEVGRVLGYSDADIDEYVRAARAGRGQTDAAARANYKANLAAESASPLADASMTPRDRIRHLARDTRDLINLTKAIPASFDNSALMGQGAIVSGARPSLVPGAVGDSARSAMSRTRFEAFKRNLVTHPNQDLRESSGLYLASIGKGEETFGSSFAEKIPLVAASQRAYEATLDSLRSNAFDLYADQLTRAGVTDPKAFKDIARWVNVATGRGELGKLEPLAGVLNLPLFSPKLLASKFQILSPIRYARMHPAARKIALTEMFRASGSLATTMGLAKLAGADVDLDPFSGGFGTIDADGTSYDLSGGRLRALRFAAQIADSLNRKQRGEVVKEDRTPAALTTKFFRAYLSPVGQLAVDAHTGENMRGEEFTGDWRELDRLLPFAVKEMREAYRQAGAMGAVKAAPAFVGVGVHTRDKSGEPIMPTLSEPVREELDRLGLDLEHLGKDGKKSAAIKPNYQTEGVTGDSFRPFGGVSGKPGRETSGMGVDAERTSSRLSAELEEALSEIINSDDYQSFESDDDRARFLDMAILNVHKRVMNDVRVDGRGAEIEKLQTVKERLDRMSAGGRSSGQKNFKL